MAMVLRKIVLFGAAFAVAAAAAPLWAQIPDWLAPGHRVRISAAGVAKPIVGVVARRMGDSVLLVAGGVQTRLAAGSIDQMEVSRALRRRTARGAAVGLVAGALVGIVAGAREGVRSGDTPARAFVGAIGFGAFGAPIGALFGSMFPIELWTRVYPLQKRSIVSLGPTGTHVGLSFPIRFHR